MDAIELTTKIAGYEAREADGHTVVGQVEGVRPRGVRIHGIPGHPGRHGYLPAEAIERIDSTIDVIVLRPGVSAEAVADAPHPPDESRDAWHMSDDWWADLLGHFGLYSPEGRGDGPFLHTGGRTRK